MGGGQALNKKKPRDSWYKRGDWRNQPPSLTYFSAVCQHEHKNPTPGSRHLEILQKVLMVDVDGFRHCCICRSNCHRFLRPEWTRQWAGASWLVSWGHKVVEMENESWHRGGGWRSLSVCKGMKSVARWVSKQLMVMLTMWRWHAAPFYVTKFDLLLLWNSSSGCLHRSF